MFTGKFTDIVRHHSQFWSLSKIIYECTPHRYIFHAYFSVIIMHISTCASKFVCDCIYFFPCISNIQNAFWWVVHQDCIMPGARILSHHQKYTPFTIHFKAKYRYDSKVTCLWSDSIGVNSDISNNLFVESWAQRNSSTLLSIYMMIYVGRTMMTV